MNKVRSVFLVEYTHTHTHHTLTHTPTVNSILRCTYILGISKIQS